MRALPLYHCRRALSSSSSSFPDLDLGGARRPSSASSAAVADAQWPSAYMRRLIFKIHPDLFQGLGDAEIAAANADSLSRLNAIVDFLASVAGDAAVIPAGAVPPAQTLAFYVRDSSSGNTNNSADAKPPPPRRIEVRFEAPTAASLASPEHLVAASRAYCSRFLLRLLQRMQIALPEATVAWVEHCARVDSSVISVSAAHVASSPKASTSAAAASVGDSDFILRGGDGSEDTEAATLGAVFGHVFPPRPAPSSQSSSSSASSSSASAPPPPHRSSAASYRRATAHDNASTQLQRSLAAHRALADDLLFTTELARNERGGVERLVRRMMASHLIFFARELGARERDQALHNFCALLRSHWYALEVRSWFGLPFMFAAEYATARAPGFIVLPYRFRAREAIEFITRRAAVIKREEPVEAVWDGEAEFDREHGVAGGGGGGGGGAGPAEDSTSFSSASSAFASMTAGAADDEDVESAGAENRDLFGTTVVPAASRSQHQHQHHHQQQQQQERSNTDQSSADAHSEAARAAEFARAASSSSSSSASSSSTHRRRVSPLGAGGSMLPRHRHGASMQDALNAAAAGARTQSWAHIVSPPPPPSPPSSPPRASAAQSRQRAPPRRGTSSSSSSSWHSADGGDDDGSAQSAASAIDHSYDDDNDGSGGGGVDWSRSMSPGGREQPSVPSPSSSRLRGYATTPGIFKF